jgi:hypothetical protein
MKHLKLFEQFSHSLNEGAIPVFAPKGVEVPNPQNKKVEGQGRYKPTFSMTWPGFVTWANKWIESGQSFSIVADMEYDKYNANPEFRSEALGTWKDKSLPLFTAENPKYDEVEFDVIDFMENKEKPNEPWVKISDKDGTEFLIPPFKILDIQLGSSVEDQIFAGFKYVIDGMRAIITNYKNRKVEVKLQDGSTRTYGVGDWKRKNYTRIDEKKNTEDNLEALNEEI